MFSASKTSGPSGYNINNSLRLRSSASAYLNRTPASTTNRRTFTYSFWYKRGEMSTSVQFLWANNASTFQTSISLSSDSGPASNISITLGNGSAKYQTTTTAVFRDPSAWYHIVIAVDTTQATSSNRLKIYVNGEQQTAFSNVNYPPQNFDTWINSNSVTHYIGASYYNGSYTYTNGEGYLAEVNFIDGQALTPSSFGSTNATTGVWQPVKYTGSYGTNGFYLPFSDIGLTSGSNTGLGKDFSGNSNYWTTNNISVTSGTTYDAMTDSPTLTSATVANYAVFNPLRMYGSNATNISSGNLKATTTISVHAYGSIAFPNSTKTYCEVTLTTFDTQRIGIRRASDWSQFGGWVALSTQIRLDDVVQQSSLSTFSTGNILGIAVDLSANTLQFYLNGSTFGSASSITNADDWILQIQNNSSATTAVSDANFGQRPFSYTPPTGFNRLNTFNLPNSTIVKGNTVMDATLYTGNGATRSITNNGSFKPDLVWIKARSIAYFHRLSDSVRGIGKELYSNDTQAETTNQADGWVSAFNSNGFSILGGAGVNLNANTFVAWQWQAGQGSTSNITVNQYGSTPSIASTVSVNTTAGFSIVTYTGNGSSPVTIGHGLGVAPKFIIIKDRSVVSSWVVQHTSLGWTQGFLGITTATASTSTLFSNNTAPTSSVFTVGGYSNNNAENYVAYCWAEIAGFSKFGSYTGNGSADGPFVYTGFRPKYVMIKPTNVIASWTIEDTARSTYNVMDARIFAEESSAELSNGNGLIDYLSNGFKPRVNHVGINGSNNTMIYMAFAENPFKNALAR
jgi:hypothetical protein